MSDRGFKTITLPKAKPSKPKTKRIPFKSKTDAPEEAAKHVNGQDNGPVPKSWFTVQADEDVGALTVEGAAGALVIQVLAPNKVRILHLAEPWP